MPVIPAHPASETTTLGHRGAGVRASAVVTLLFVALTVVITWPQVAHLASIPDNVDSYFSLWRLGWIAHQLAHDPAHLFDGNIFYPAPHTLAYSDAILLPGLVGAPFIWLGVPVVIVYNALVLASFVLCGLGTFLLVRDLSGQNGAAIIAGIIFAFATTRFDHYFHLELLWAQWMPLALWRVHRLLKTGTLKDGLLTGGFLAALGFSCIYYTVFFATVLVVMVPVLMLAVPRARLRRTVLALSVAALLAAVVLLPYMLMYATARVEVGERNPGLAVLYGAGPKHYVAVTPGNLLWGRATAFLGRHEKRLFPGAVALLLAIVALRRFDATRVAYLLMIAVAVEVSFGHRAFVFMWLRDHVMLYRGLRVPARAGHVVLLGVAVLAGLGVSGVAGWLQRTRVAWRVPTLTGVAVLAVAEYLVAPLALVAVPTTAPPVYQWLRQQPAGVVAEMPLPPPIGGPSYDAQFQYLSTFHWRPLINGYSGEGPGAYNFLLRKVADFPSDGSLATLRRAGVDYVVLHEREYGRERFAAITRVLDQRTDVTAHGLFDDGPFAVRVYRLGAQRAN